MKDVDLIVAITDDANVRNFHNFWVYDVFTGLNWWHHIVAVFNGSNARSPLKVYVDGVQRGADSVDGSDPADMTFTEQKLEVHIPLQVGCQITDKFNIGQTALWNTALDTDEVRAIFKGRFLTDLRANKGDYKSSKYLQHYWFFFPQEPDIRDHELFLVDKDGVILSDLINKALTDETWPHLSKFYVRNDRGVPHDSVEGLGYQEYGGLTDTWGANFYWDDVNSPEWGVVLRAKNQEGTFDGNAYVDHMKMAVYWTDPGKVSQITALVEVEAANFFYIRRESFGGLFNAVEVGEDLGD
jgi:hypothetical protein